MRLPPPGPAIVLSSTLNRTRVSSLLVLFRFTPGSLLLNYLFETFCGDVFKCASFFRHIRATWSKVGPSTC